MYSSYIVQTQLKLPVLDLWYSTYTLTFVSVALTSRLALTINEGDSRHFHICFSINISESLIYQDVYHKIYIDLEKESVMGKKKRPWIYADTLLLQTFLFSEDDFLSSLDYSHVTFNGTYSTGDSECIEIFITALEDNFIEDTETLSIYSFSNFEDDFPMIQVFIIDNDCKYSYVKWCHH